jgi:hypothetical protein
MQIGRINARQEREEAGRVGPLLSGGGDVHGRASDGVIGVEMGTKGNIGLESSFFYHTSVWVHLDGLYWARPAGFYRLEVRSSMNHTGRLFASSMIA